uniref:DUF1084 domain-containing protein n=1 Tax=Panagrellus redivivus TaxID=6233 RepID=A0A7E4WDH2_PANRE
MSIFALHEVDLDSSMNWTNFGSMNSTLAPPISDGMQGMIALIQYVFTSIAIVVSFIVLVEISWKHGPRSKHPASLFIGIYIVDAFLFCIFGAVFCGYAIVFWQMEASGYDALPLFWTGFPLSIIVGSIHITVQFLAFDRLVAILRPSDFLIGNKVMARILGVICVSGQLCYAVNTTGIVMQDRPMESKRTHCYAFICMVSNSRIVVYLLYRTIFGGLNIILGWTMYLVLKRNRSSIGRKERRNIATRIAITTFLRPNQTSSTASAPSADSSELSKS